MVGGAGIEPATSRSQTARATAALRPADALQYTPCPYRPGPRPRYARSGPSPALGAGTPPRAAYTALHRHAGTGVAGGGSIAALHIRRPRAAARRGRDALR